MRIFPGRRRLALAVIVAAAVAGLAAGLVFARDDSNSALAQGPRGLIAQGKFRSITWSTLGTASLVREASGDLRLHLSHNFMTKDAPETYIYLAKFRGQRRTFWKEVAELKSAQGSQEYKVSSDAATPGVQVAIFCAKCNKISGVAQLEAVPAAS
jgi:hypothetical protein